MPVYRPRVACVLHVPIIGGSKTDVATIPIRPRRVSLEFNSHNQADSASVSAEWRDIGVDPRIIKDATCEIHIGNADENDRFTPTDATLRFIGIMTRPRRTAKDGGGFDVSLEFHDYTELFLRQKPFPTAGLPSYSDDLFGAWQKICDYTGPLDEEQKVISVVDVLRNRLEFRGGVDPGTLLGSAVASRFAKLQKVAAKEKSDAWAVWQQCVGMCGLISYIDRDACIITTTTEHYGPEDAPKFIWGHNILDLEEEANAHFSDKGVAITSFDARTGRTLEAFYPHPDDKRIRRKRIRASKKKAKPVPFESERYDYYAYEGVNDVDRLEAIAQRVWDERSRQEMQGKLKTAEMFVDTVSKDIFDVLSIRAGDNVCVQIDPTDNETLRSIGSSEEQIDYLMARGYRLEVADLIVRNMKASELFDMTLHATRVNVELAADGDAGTFTVDIAYQNRIKIRPEGSEIV